ncbi:MAG: hypothetical protein ISS82_06025 [Nanoarchaeota archaeon]|nr:hypothetical protein [Nanoarchaeota archaeon]
MVSITVSVEDFFKERLKIFPWVNWSEVGREETLKRDIFDRFIKTRKLSEFDQEFCDLIDWHPVDELPLKEEYVKKLKKIEKGPHSRMTLKELDKLLGLK